MNSPRFDRFSQPHYLQRLGRERLTQVLLPFAPELWPLGLALPAVALPDEIFFILLAQLPRQAAHLSSALLEAMTAIEVMEMVYPDETAAAPGPVVVTELRLRLAERARPVLLTSGSQHGALDCMMTVPGLSDARESSTLAPAVPVLEMESQRVAVRPTKAVARFKFRQKGNVCVVKFDGLPKFHLANTDGAKYLDQVLHRENESFRVVELERLVKPDKTAARTVNSIQRALDPQALRELRSELVELEAELAEAESAGRAAEAAQLEAQMAQIKKCLIANAQLDGDSGERARNNVRKAIGRSIARLRKGGPAEQAFARHLTESLLLGYEVMYVQPLGKIWS